MLVKTFGSAVYGINAVTITVEVSVGQGIKYFMVGLLGNAVKAIKHIGYKMRTLIDRDENKLTQPKSYHLEVSNFVKSLDEGLAKYKQIHP